MAYDEELAERLAEILAAERGVTQKKMFGGLAFLVDGHMAVSAGGRGGLMVRVATDETEALLAQPHATPFVMRGRELRGWLHVAPAGAADDAALRRWVALGVEYARSLPPK